MQFSQRWSELTALRVSLGAKLSAGQVEAYSNIQCAVDKAFDLWLMGDTPDCTINRLIRP